EFQYSEDNLLSGLGDVTDKVREFIKEKLSQIYRTVSTVWDGINDYFSNGSSDVGISVITAEENVQAYKPAFELMNEIATQAESAWESISTAYSTGSQELTGTNTTVSTALTDLNTSFSKTFTDIQTIASSVWDSIKTVLYDMSTEFKDFQTSAITGWENITNAFKQAKTQTTQEMTSMQSDFTSMLTSFTTDLSSIISTTTSGWDEVLSVLSTAHSGISSHAGGISDILSSMSGDFSSYMESIISAINSAVNSIVNAVNSVTNAEESIVTNVPRVSGAKQSSSGNYPIMTTDTEMILSKNEDNQYKRSTRGVKMVSRSLDNKEIQESNISNLSHNRDILLTKQEVKQSSYNIPPIIINNYGGINDNMDVDAIVDEMVRKLMKAVENMP
ncbi:MAG: hypothetical protein ACI4EN_04370, partial [Butyrivibrio sp.]